MVFELVSWLLLVAGGWWLLLRSGRCGRAGLLWRLLWRLLRLLVVAAAVAGRRPLETNPNPNTESKHRTQTPPQVKNSLRAVQDRFEAAADGAGAGSPDGAGAAAASSGSPDGDEPPPIRLVVAEGAEDVTIKVSDEGGGIPRSGLARIWSYLYSTAKNPALLDAAAESEAGGGAGSGDGSAGGGSSGPQAPALAGYGYGLPLR